MTVSLQHATSASERHPQSCPTPALLRGVLGLFLLTVLSGSFAFDRILGNNAGLGEFWYLRTWLTLGLWVVIPMTLVGRTMHVRQATTAWLWMGIVFLLHAYIAVSATWAPSPRTSSAEVASVLFAGLLLLLAVPLFAQAPQQYTNTFLGLVLWAALLYAVAGIIGFELWNHVGRMAALGGGPNVFVRVMGMGLIVSVYRFSGTRQRRWLLLLPLLLICAIASGSRGGLIALLFTFPLYILLLIWRGDVPRRVLLFGVGLLVLVGGLLAWSDTLSEFVEFRFLDLTFRQQYGLTQRTALLEEAWSIFLSYPISGIGLDGYRQTTIYGVVYAHNLILQIAAEGGIPGLICMAVAFGVLMTQSHRQKDLIHLTVLFLGLYHLVANMFSGSYVDARWMWLFFLLYLLPMQPGLHQIARNTLPSPSRLLLQGKN